MSAQVDEIMVREFIELISAHVRQVINGTGQPGLLQIYRLNPVDESTTSNRFLLDDTDTMVKIAIDDAMAGHNVYMEARTVRPDLKGKLRGATEDTVWVFGLVADCDADKGKGGNIRVRPSLVIETSPGNFHYWYLLTRAISASQAQPIGEAMRASSGTDHDTGVITQGYRVAGTPNYPTTAKQARGRTTIEPTRISEQTGRLWDPDELLQAFQPSTGPPATSTPSSTTSASAPDDETTLPDELLKDIREGGPGKNNDKTRSALFQSVVNQLKRRHWTVEAIVKLFEKYPNGVAAKYKKRRLRKEVERSYNKVAGGILTGSTATVGATAAGPTVAPGAASAAPGATTTAAPQPTAAPHHVLPTIQLVAGRLPEAVAATERALIASGMPIFARAGMLVYPVAERMTAADGRKTVMARLRAFSADSFIEPVAEAAIFQRWDGRSNHFVDVDPPLQLVRMVLTRDRRWVFPRVSGIITTPTLRCDGSLLATSGYDQRSELYLLPGIQLPPIPEHPTRAQAEAALATIKDLFSEFSFKRKDLDCSVAISGLLTAQLRGSLPTAPIYLVRADTSGTGKSYLVDVIAMIANGRPCPAIAASDSKQETEKQLGSILLDGVPIVSLDNCDHDLGGNLLCEFTERPVVKVRILGQSEMPECESHTTVFATGNNITFRKDMLRRGLVCDLEALDERPELRVFKRDPLEVAAGNRGLYVAAVLTIVRAYFTAGTPQVCGPLGSYAMWSRMVRSPLVWLGEPDPVTSQDDVREEDWDLANIREFFELWLAYDLGLDVEQTSTDIIEIACRPPAPNNYAPQSFKYLLLRVAAAKDAPDVVSPDRLGWWLRRVSGRVVSLVDANGEKHRYRLMKQPTKIRRRCFRLLEVA